jgi:hypothetical protein
VYTIGGVGRREFAERRHLFSSQRFEHGVGWLTTKDATGTDALICDRSKMDFLQSFADAVQVLLTWWAVDHFCQSFDVSHGHPDFGMDFKGNTIG